jgi:hypothetical protein
MCCLRLGLRVRHLHLPLGRVPGDSEVARAAALLLLLTLAHRRLADGLGREVALGAWSGRLHSCAVVRPCGLLLGRIVPNVLVACGSYSRTRKCWRCTRRRRGNERTAASASCASHRPRASRGAPLELAREMHLGVSGAADACCIVDAAAGGRACDLVVISAACTGAVNPCVVQAVCWSDPTQAVGQWDLPSTLGWGGLAPHPSGSVSCACTAAAPSSSSP